MDSFELVLKTPAFIRIIEEAMSRGIGVGSSSSESGCVALRDIYMYGIPGTVPPTNVGHPDMTATLGKVFIGVTCPVDRVSIQIVTALGDVASERTKYTSCS